MSDQIQSPSVRLGDLPRPAPPSRREAARRRLMMHVQSAVHTVARRSGVDSRTMMAGALEQKHLLAPDTTVTATSGDGQLLIEACGNCFVRQACLSPGTPYPAVEDAIATLLADALPSGASARSVDLKV